MHKTELYFHKMHGLGNDFVFFIDHENINFNLDELTKDQIVILSDRNKGIGCDQLIIVKTLEQIWLKEYDYEMIIFNQDGSKAQVCGNATRCLVGLLGRSGQNIRIKSAEKILSACLDGVERDGRVEVLMLRPSFLPEVEEVLLEESTVIHSNYIKINWQQKYFSLQIADGLLTGGKLIEGFYTNVGNPHLVFNLHNLEDFELNLIGQKINSLSCFPKQFNVNFVQIIDRDNIILRVFERGVGLTNACGSGACASVVSLFARNILNSEVNVFFAKNVNLIEQNNKINIRVDQNNNIYMKAGYSYVFRGYINLDNVIL